MLSTKIYYSQHGNSGAGRRVRKWREHVLAMKEGSDEGTVQYVDSGEPLGTHSS